LATLGFLKVYISMLMLFSISAGGLSAFVRNRWVSEGGGVSLADRRNGFIFVAQRSGEAWRREMNRGRVNNDLDQNARGEHSESVNWWRGSIKHGLSHGIGKLGVS
jgi:hypothetical protein